MKWNKKTYETELKKGYWDLEPHFHYYCLIKFFSLFENFMKEKMNFDDVTSALYGKFVCEGKPIKKGFYNNMNLTSEIIDKIYKEVAKKEK